MGTYRSRILVLFALTAMLAAACAGSTPEGDGGDQAAGGADGTEATDGGGGDAAGGEVVFAIAESDSAAHENAVELFNENNDIQARIEFLPPEADEQRRQLFQVLNAQGSDFDVVALDVIWTGEFAANGWIEPLDDLSGELEGNTLEGPLESATWDGQLWAVPYNSNAGFLYYRTDLVDSPPETWDELCEVGMAAAEEAGGIAPLVGQGAQYEGLVVNYLEYFWGAGGELYNEDQSEVLYGEDDAATQALEFMQTANENGCYVPGFNNYRENEAFTSFLEGEAVFMRNWPYAYALLSDEEQSQVAGNFDIAPLPTFDGDGTTSALGGFNLAVNAFSENKEAAKEFITYLSQNQQVQVEMGSEFSVPPTLQAAYDELSDDPVMQLLGEVLPEARARPPVPGYNILSEAIQQNVFPAYNGEMPIDAAVEAVTDAAQEAAAGEGS